MALLTFVFRGFCEECSGLLETCPMCRSVIESVRSVNSDQDHTRSQQPHASELSVYEVGQVGCYSENLDGRGYHPSQQESHSPSNIPITEHNKDHLTASNQLLHVLHTSSSPTSSDIYWNCQHGNKFNCIYCQNQNILFTILDEINYICWVFMKIDYVWLVVGWSVNAL